jgi:hypothetical protein
MILMIYFFLGNNDKARKAAKAVKKSQWKKALKPRYSVVFHRPSTLKRTRNAKVPRVRYVIIQDKVRDGRLFPSPFCYI